MGPQGGYSYYCSPTVVGPQGGGAGMPFVVSVKCSPDTRQDVAGLSQPPYYWLRNTVLNNLPFILKLAKHFRDAPDIAEGK